MIEVPPLADQPTGFGCTRLVNPVEASAQVFVGRRNKTKSDGISSLGWIARNMPQRAVHKIRNGVASADMLWLKFLDLSSIADLSANLQSLDRE